MDQVKFTPMKDGDIYTPHNHDEYAAAILHPFVREQCAWVVEKHGDFQLAYYGQHVGANPNKRVPLQTAASTRSGSYWRLRVQS